MNKLKIILPLLLFSFGTFYVANQMAHANHQIRNIKLQVIPADFVLTNQNKPTAELQELLDLLQIKYNGSFDSLVKETQANWLRQAGKERWQVAEVHDKLQQQILQSAEKLGLMHEIAPTQTNYDYALILGATLSRVRSRIAYLASQWKKGIKFDTLILLGSERALDASIETADHLVDTNNKDLAIRADWKFDGNLPKTEYEMILFVFEQADIPLEMRSLPIKFINAPNFKNADGSLRRATTGDTIQEWLKESPKPGSCLFISSQPYVAYQDSVVRTYVPASFGLIETCGAQSRSNVRNAEILDTLARIIYQEKVRREAKA